MLNTAIFKAEQALARRAILANERQAKKSMLRRPPTRLMLRPSDKHLF